MELQNAYRQLYREIAREFNILDRPHQYEDLSKQFHAPMNGASGYYMQVTPKYAGGCIHYEWDTRVTQSKTIDIALHFEFQNQTMSMDCLDKLIPHVTDINDKTGYAVTIRQFGKLSAELMVRVPYCGEFPDLSVTPEAARVMKIFIDCTRSLVELSELEIQSQYNATQTTANLQSRQLEESKLAFSVLESKEKELNDVKNKLNDQAELIDYASEEIRRMTEIIASLEAEQSKHLSELEGFKQSKKEARHDGGQNSLNIFTFPPDSKKSPTEKDKTSGKQHHLPPGFNKYRRELIKIGWVSLITYYDGRPPSNDALVAGIYNAEEGKLKVTYSSNFSITLLVETTARGEAECQFLVDYLNRKGLNLC